MPEEQPTEKEGEKEELDKPLEVPQPEPITIPEPTKTKTSNLEDDLGNQLTKIQKTDLTDGGETTLHKHDHGILDGLNDNDHGAIYYTKAEVDALLATVGKFGGTGVDGDKTVSANEQLTTYKIYNYDDLTINAGKTLSFGSNFQNKIVIIKVAGDCVINGKIDLAGMGGLGMPIYHTGTASVTG